MVRGIVANEAWVSSTLIVRSKYAPLAEQQTRTA